MKELNVIVVADDIIGVKQLLLHLVTRIYLAEFGVNQLDIMTTKGLIRYKIYDSKEKDMTNIILLEEDI